MIRAGGLSACRPGDAHSHNRMQNELPGTNVAPAGVGPGRSPGGRGSEIHAGAPVLSPGPRQAGSEVVSSASQRRLNVPSVFDILSSCLELVLRRLMMGNMIPVMDDLMKAGLWPWRFCNCPPPQAHISNAVVPQAPTNNLMRQARNSNASAVGAPVAQSTPQRRILVFPNHDHGYRGNFSFLDNPSMPAFEFPPESQVLLQRQLHRIPAQAASPPSSDLIQFSRGPMHRSIVNPQMMNPLRQQPCCLPPEQNSIGGAGQISRLSPAGPLHRSLPNPEFINSLQQRPCCRASARSLVTGPGQSPQYARTLVTPNQVSPRAVNISQGNQRNLTQEGSPAPFQGQVGPPGTCRQNNQRQHETDLSISGWSSFNRTGNPNNPDFSSASYY